MPSSGEDAQEVFVEFVKSIDIDAPSDVVWAVMSDGERWPEWTASVTSVRRLDKGPLRIGTRALIRQPRFPPAVWTVTTLEPGHRFVWKSGMPGMWVYGDHSAAPITHGTRAGLLNVVHSFAFDPMSTGTLFCLFCAKRLRTVSGNA